MAFSLQASTLGLDLRVPGKGLKGRQDLPKEVKMAYQHLSHIKHTLRLTSQEIALLRDRLVPISPMDYELPEYAILRHLYGRFDHLIIFDDIMLSPRKGG